MNSPVEQSNQGEPKSSQYTPEHFEANTKRWAAASSAPCLTCLRWNRPIDPHHNQNSIGVPLRGSLCLVTLQYVPKIRIFKTHRKFGKIFLQNHSNKSIFHNNRHYFQ